MFLFLVFLMYKLKKMNTNFYIHKITKILSFLIFIGLLQGGCNGKLPGADARKFPDDPKLRVKKNLEEGRGFRINDAFQQGMKGGVFDFASSNELWRASLDVIDFMPLSSVNYSGGIIITDWYSSDQNQNESIKISIRFLTNEIRADALDIKIFTRKCIDTLINCKYIETSRTLEKEITREILKKATLYQKQDLEKKKEK